MDDNVRGAQPRALGERRKAYVPDPGLVHFPRRTVPHRVRVARSSIPMATHQIRVPSSVPGRPARPVRVTLAGQRARPAEPSHRLARRRWARRGRRAQVSAVATILGLLLVVTMVANYLGTQLPAQMRTNDANHALTVENQVARLDASLKAAAGAYAVGGVVTQPVSLGSLGAPPFAPADSSSIGPGAQGSLVAASFTLTGGATFNPPAVGPAGGASYKSCSTQTSTTLTCSTSSKVVWNFTASSPSAFTITTSGGPYYVNISASGSTISYTASSSSPDYLLIVGNNDTLSLTVSGSASGIHVVLIGNNDQVNLLASSWSSSTITVLAVGNDDSVSTGTLSASNSHLTATFFGAGDTTTLGTTSASNSGFNVYFNGFVPSSPSSSCPVDNLAATTDSISNSGSQSGGTYNVTYNDTTATSGTPPPSPWKGTFATPASFSCPFFSVATIPQRYSGAVGATFVVHLRNTYGPAADIAFDQGAVVYAQSNGVPEMLVAPGLVFSGGTLSFWIPEFAGQVGTESGAGTAELSVRVDSVMNLTLPEDGFGLKSGTTVYLNVTTPYAAAWSTNLSAYLNTTTLKGVASVTCQATVASVCKGPFAFSGPLGTVEVAVPARAVAGFDFEIATYSVALD
jgi:hypothetical protein